MYIESISFSKKPIDGIGWELKECNFNKINLIAGQNSSGKTRLLKSIDVLVKILLNNNSKIEPRFNFKWKITLKGKKHNYIYEVEIQDNNVFFEKLLINGDEYFSRDKNGTYTIKYEEAKTSIQSEIARDKFVLSTKYQDRIQHSMLEAIFKWVNSVYMYNFGDTLGRNTLINATLNIDEDELYNRISKDDNAVVLKFEKGFKEYGKKFKSEIIKDFNHIGYNLEDINTTKVNEIFEKMLDIQSTIPSILYIQEKEVDDKIFQQDISQGMFRVLSLIIQIKYLEYSLDFDTTILIDDIGEGLDYERANKLIKYIINKVKKLENKVQLIMTTNDRFTMNSVPLEYWIIINKQDNGKIDFYTKRTHQECFEDFEDIGLNNFDFFAGEYYKNCVGID